jgi:hypothetical protein
MVHYRIHFKAKTSMGISEHTRSVSLDLPIEYTSDIGVLEEWCAKEVGATSAMLLSWTPLVGESRPATKT